MFSAAVNGSWNQWSDWSGCDSKRPGEKENRTRTCTKATNGGADCPGESFQERDCDSPPPIVGLYSVLLLKEHSRMLTRTHTRMFTRILARTHACTHALKHTRMHARTHQRMHTNKHIHRQACTHAYTYTCMLARIYHYPPVQTHTAELYTWYRQNIHTQM
jgi:hypothetical protein